MVTRPYSVTCSPESQKFSIRTELCLERNKCFYPDTNPPPSLKTCIQVVSREMGCYKNYCGSSCWSSTCSHKTCYLCKPWKTCYTCRLKYGLDYLCLDTCHSYSSHSHGHSHSMGHLHSRYCYCYCCYP